MYKKITSQIVGKDIKVGSLLAMYYGPDNQASSHIRRGFVEHYQVTKFNTENQFELSTPEDEIPDGPIYINGIAIVPNDEPLCYRSILEFIEDDCWWLLVQE